MGSKRIIEVGSEAMALIWRKDKELTDSCAGEVFDSRGEVIVAIDSGVADEAVHRIFRLLIHKKNLPALVRPLIVVQLDVGATFNVEEDKDLEVGEERFTGWIVDGGVPDLVGLRTYLARCKESSWRDKWFVGFAARQAGFEALEIPLERLCSNPPRLVYVVIRPSNEARNIPAGRYSFRVSAMSSATTSPTGFFCSVQLMPTHVAISSAAKARRTLRLR